MKRRTTDRRVRSARAPREIRVRMAAPRPAGGAPDVWVVNGRVIRFLDPSRPEDPAVGREHRGVLSGFLGALRPRRRGRPTVG